MRHYKLMITRIICILVVSCSVVALLAVSVKTFVNDEITKISWELNGVWVTDDGVEEGTVPFKVEGKVTDYKLEKVADKVNVEFEFPEDFPYEPNQGSDRFSYVNGFFDVDYFGCNDYSGAPETDYLIKYQYALDIEREYVLVCWSDEPERYLVASVDPNVKPEDIVKHFKAFLNAGDPLEKEHDISWNVHGTWITDEGELQGTVDFSVEAHVVDIYSDTEFDRVNFDCVFPYDFRYYMSPSDPCNYSHTGRNHQSYFGFLCGAIDREVGNGAIVDCFFAFDLEKEYVFIKWGRGNRPTLVASVDPNVDPKEILEHFDGFLDSFKFAS